MPWRTVRRLIQFEGKAQRSRLTFSDAKEQGPAEAVSAFNIELASGTPLALLPEKLEEFREVFRISAGDLRRAGIQGYIHSVSPVQAKALPRSAGDATPIASVERPLEVFDAFEAGPGALTLVELSERTGLYKSTILRIVETLAARGHLVREADGTYQISFGLA